MERWTPSLPPLSICAWLAPVVLAGLCAVFTLAGRLRTRRGVRSGYTRKLLHFSLFGAAALLAMGFGPAGVNLLGGIGALVVAFALWRGDGHPFYEAMARPSDAPHRQRYVIVPFLATVLGGIVASLAFGAYAVVGYLVAGCGDAIAEPVGLRFGRHRYRAPGLGDGVRSERSIEGSVAVFAVSCAAAVAAFAALELPGDWNVTRVVLGALAVGGVAAIVEGLSPHGVDNLTVQLAAAGVAALASGTTLTAG